MQHSLDIEQLYRNHGQVVLRRARKILRNEQEANEVLQEVFLSLLARPEQYSGRSSINTWLYSVTTNMCLNKLRKHKTRSRLMEDVVAPSQVTEEAPRAEDKTHLTRLLARLPEKLSRVAVYYYMDEMTHEEIAKVMNCSRRQVGNLLKRFQDRAKNQLRNAA
ncbi:MAG: RNA polymerase sigma factor [Myxococcota bacterium]